MSEEITRTAARRALHLPSEDKTSFTVSITSAWLSIVTTGPPTSTPTPTPTSMVKEVKGWGGGERGWVGCQVRVVATGG